MNSPKAGESAAWRADAVASAPRRARPKASSSSTMRVRKLAAALALVLAAGSSSVARGSADVAIEARQHFELGQKYFSAGDYEAAIGEFKRAYVISPAPGLLFNIAQAYRARKDNEQAL